ncbi:hydrolase-like protein [Trypanosoma theileri]|uniref:Hydrolase-like protein n=1 Tax=Trypanosoma theileri TaxID=67003 RepID=A0A1X0NSR3_9TRYP|nr:hydrolase-like protein [Trypanosoma theileri]ORC87746.1 hydrolase-like protein [Trypanosoma theileri]
MSIKRSDERITFVRHCTASNMRIELCYQCFGDPNDKLPVVLLIGGLNMQMYAWDESFCEELVRHGFFVIRFDNRDIGHSTKIEERGNVISARLLLPQTLAFGERLPYTIEDMARDALSLLDSLNIPFAHIMGISMGGMIAQTVALLAPQRVLSLTSIMSTTNAADLPDPQFWVKMWLLRKPPANCSIEELLDFRVNSLKKLLVGTLPVDDEYLKNRYLISLRRSSYSAGLIRQAAAIRRCPGRDEALRSLSCPTLVIHGREDVLMPPAHGYRTASVIPQAKLVILNNMGHYFHPAFFTPIITHFVEVANTCNENNTWKNRSGLDVPEVIPVLNGLSLEEYMATKEKEKEDNISDNTSSTKPITTKTTTTTTTTTSSSSITMPEVVLEEQNNTNISTANGEGENMEVDPLYSSVTGFDIEEVRSNIINEQRAEASLLSSPKSDEMNEN